MATTVPQEEPKIKKFDGSWFKDEWLDGKVHAVSPDLTGTDISATQICKLFKLIAAYRGHYLKTTVIGGIIHIQENGKIPNA